MDSMSPAAAGATYEALMDGPHFLSKGIGSNNGGPSDDVLSSFLVFAIVSPCLVLTLLLLVSVLSVNAPLFTIDELLNCLNTDDLPLALSAAFNASSVVNFISLQALILVLSCFGDLGQLDSKSCPRDKRLDSMESSL